MSIEFIMANSCRIECGATAPAMLAGSENTVSAWIFPRSSGDLKDGRIAVRGNFGSASLVFGIINTSALIMYEVWTGNDKHRYTGNVFTLNTWNHVLGTFGIGPAYDNFKIYVNGSETSYVFNQDGSGVAEDNSSFTFKVGGDSNAARTFDGFISELAVWNTILTSSEISLLASSRTRYIPLQVRPSSLVTYLPLDEVSQGVSVSVSNIIRDRSSYGNNGSSQFGTGGANPVGSADQVLSYP